MDGSETSSSTSSTPGPALSSAPAPRLLALRALKLGDLLVAVPALRGLRRAFPRHRIVLACPGWLAPIVDLIDAVDEHLPTPGLDDPLACDPGTVDIAVNLHGNGAGSRALIAGLAARRSIVHRSAVEPWGAVEWDEELNERERWVRLVNAAEPGAVADPHDVRIARSAVPAPRTGAAVVHVGAARASRYWPLERFAETARALADDGLTVVVTGGAAEVARAEEVVRLAGLPPSAMLAGRAGLGEFAALIAEAVVVVTADTGAAHLASAYGTPSVIVFGPAPPEIWGPPPGPHVVLTDASRRRGDAFATDPDPALLAVSAAQVIAAARSVRRVREAQHSDR